MAERKEYLDETGLARYHSHVNDMTTGINLVCGTRDFRLGADPIAHVYKDGFSAAISQYISIIKGDDGFSIGHLEQHGTSTNVYRNFVSSAITNFKKGDVFTLSFEFMVDDASTYIDQKFPFAVVIRDITTSQNLASTTYSLLNLGIPQVVESKVWYTAKVSYEVVNDITENHVLYCAFQLIRDGSINFRKLMVQNGKISHPIWAPSPADLVMEPVNDMTTGINLLRGTRDFSYGRTHWNGSSNWTTDGFSPTDTEKYFTKSIDENGFTVLHTESPNGSTTVKSAYASVLTGFNSGDVVTYSFDFMIDDIDEYFSAATSHSIARYDVFDQNANVSSSGVNFTLYDGVLENVQSGKWYRWSKAITLSGINSSRDGVMFSSRITRSGGISFRKFKLERGAIINPVYSVSPADVLLKTDPVSGGSSIDLPLSILNGGTGASTATKAKENLGINDITTGINLLRGTKDFTFGTTKGTKLPTWNFIDGFQPSSEYSFYKDNLGFTVCKITQTGVGSTIFKDLQSSVIEDINVGETLTFYLEFMFENLDTPLASSTIFGGIRGITSNIVPVNVSSLTLTKLGITNFEQGKWYSGHITTTISDPDAIVSNVYIRLIGNGSLHIRKLCVYKGNIEHPEWAPNPFDSLSIEQGGTGWTHGLNSGINLVPGTSNEWSEWITPPYNASNKGGSIATVSFPKERILGDIYTTYIEFEFEDVTATEGDHVFRFIIHGTVNDNWDHGASSPLTDGIHFNGYENFPGKENGTRIFKFTRKITDSYYLEAEKFTVQWRVDWWATGRFRYRCLKIERGYVDLPQWSPAPEDLAKINDITTGINLLRATRDFTLGTTKLSTTNSNLTDGWRISTDSSLVNTSIIKDKDGFSVLNFTTKALNNGSSTHFTIAYGSVVSGVNSNESLTLAYDVMIDDVSLFTDLNVVAVSHYNSASTLVANIFDYKFSNIGITPESGKWYRVVLHFSSGQEAYNDGDYLLIKLQLPVLNNERTKVGCSINYRKVALYRGTIEHPEWSISPFDLAMEPVNDITTIANLVRGSEYFRLGVLPSKYNTFYKSDGFGLSSALNTSNIELTKDDDGFSVFRCNATGDMISNAIILDDLQKDMYTIQFDFMVDENEIEEFNNGTMYISYIAFRNSVGTGLSGSMDVRKANHNLPENIEANKWYTVTNTIRPTHADSKFLTVSLRSEAGFHPYFRKLFVCRGAYKHVEWTPSPFDYVDIGTYPYLMGIVDSLHIVKNGDDLNNYKTPGVYYLSSALSASNSPVKNAGARIYVECGGADKNNYIRQRFVFLGESAFEYIRTYENAAWTPWRQTYANTTIRPIEGGGTGASTIDEALSNLKVFKTHVTTPVEDLNSIKDGYSTCGPNTKNSPNKSFYFMVNQIRNDSGPWLLQIAITASVGRSYTYFRSNINNTGWSAWTMLLNDSSYAYPYNPGLYNAQSIATKFVEEIGSTHIATWLSQRVKAGNFEGLNIGDYVDILCSGTTRRYIIADIDPYYRFGSPERMGHHIVMVPNERWSLDSSRDGSYGIGSNKHFIAWSNSSNNNATQEENSPYLASNLHKWELEVALKQFPQEWQDSMIDFATIVETRYNGSGVLTTNSGVKWASLGKLWSPSLFEITGISNGVSFDACRLQSHFALFNKASSSFRTSSFWTRDVRDNSSSHVIAFSNAGGMVPTSPTAETNCAYPCFLIG